MKELENSCSCAIPKLIDLELYEKNAYPLSCIGPVSIIIVALADAADAAQVS
jgi:hypothetical protein